MKRGAASTGLPRWLEAGLFRGVRLLAAVTGSRNRVDLIICKVDRLGDWLLAGPAIMALLEQAAAAGQKTTVWAAAETRPLRAFAPLSAPIEEIPFHSAGLLDRAGKLLRLAWILGKYKARDCVYLRHEDDLMHRLVVRYCQADQILANGSGGAAGLVADPAQSVPLQIRRHAALLKRRGLSPDPAALLPHFPSEPSGRSPSGLLLAPFASTPDRSWSDGSWASALELLGCDGRTVTIPVTEAQRPAAEILAQTLRSVRGAGDIRVEVHDLPGLIQALKGAELILAVDSFVAHLAIAHDLPTVALVGGGQFGEFAPWSLSARQEWISHPLPCFGCQWDCTRASVECLGDITPGAVAAAARRLLGLRAP